MIRMGDIHMVLLGMVSELTFDKVTPLKKKNPLITDDEIVTMMTESVFVKHIDEIAVLTTDETAILAKEVRQLIIKSIIFHDETAQMMLKIEGLI